MSTEQDGGGGSGTAPRRSPGSSTMDPLIGQVVLGRYEVERRIGAGGMGSVYVGKQKTVGRNVALKILRSDLTTNEHVRERFRREAEIIGKLRHPNTIQLIDYGETDEGMAVMVMELLVGRPLNDRLRESGPMPLAEALTVGIEVASSLAEAHLLGLVHRDLKPANIFLVEVAGQTHAKVLDFGIARILDEEATRLTSTGQVFGTPRYMSPEQALSTGEVDARSDIYSLGLIIYECIVGQPPFVAQTSIQYLSAHSTMPPPKLREHYPDAPEVLEQLIDACLAKDPEDRPQTADDVAQALSAIRRAVESGGVDEPIHIPRGASAGGTGNTKTAMSPRKNASSGLTATAIAGAEKTAQVDKTLVRPRSDTAITAPPAKPPYAIYGAIAAVVVAVVAAGVIFWSQSREVVSLPLDASVIAAPALPDATAIAQNAPDAAADVAPDASQLAEHATVEDAGSAAENAAPDAGAKLADTHATKGTKHGGTKSPGQKGVGTPGDRGVVTGPANMVIDTGGEGDRELLKIAASCKDSVLKGDARLTVKGCPAGCAVLVQEKCGGTTPTKELPVEAGWRDVVVVCNGQIRGRTKDAVRFEAGKTVVVPCR